MRLLSALLLLVALSIPAIAQQPPAPPEATVAPAVAPADPYTVAGIVVDIPVGNAQEARDKALLAAERQALVKLREQLAASDNMATISEPSDAQLGRLVQNFEIANERISARRYSGIFTIRFRPHAVVQAAPTEATVASEAAPTGSLIALYRFSSLSQWTAMQQRLLQTGVVRSISLKAIGRGYVRAALYYSGSADALNNALGAQGLNLQQDTGGWLLTGTEGL